LAPHSSFLAGVQRTRMLLLIEATPRGYGVASGFFRKEGAPALRADYPLNRFAGARRLEKATPVAALCVFRLVLVRDRVLGHLGLRGGKIRPEALDDRSTYAIGHRAPEKNTSRRVLRFGCHGLHPLRYWLSRIYLLSERV
jgi:hypothetical protein